MFASQGGDLQSGSRHPLIYVQHTATLEKHTAGVIAVRFSPDGQTLMSTDGNVIHFWNGDAEGNWTHQQTFHVRALFPRFSPDGTLLVFRDEEDRLQVWSREGQQLAILQSEWQGKVDFVVSPDGKWLVTGDLYGQIQLWNMETFQLQATFVPIFPDEREETRPRWSHQFSFAPDGNTFSFVSPVKHGWVHICTFDPQSFRLRKVKSLPHSVTSDVKISPNGSVLAVSNFNKNSIDVYETQRFERIVSLSMEDRSGFLAFSPDGLFLASDRDDGTVCIWSMQIHQLMTSFAAHPGLWTEQADAIGGLAWSPRGDAIATGGASSFLNDNSRDDYTVKIWKVRYEI